MLLPPNKLDWVDVGAACPPKTPEPPPVAKPAPKIELPVAKMELVDALAKLLAPVEGAFIALKIELPLGLPKRPLPLGGALVAAVIPKTKGLLSEPVEAATGALKAPKRFPTDEELEVEGLDGFAAKRLPTAPEPNKPDPELDDAKIDPPPEARSDTKLLPLLGSEPKLNNPVLAVLAADVAAPKRPEPELELPGGEVEDAGPLRRLKIELELEFELELPAKLLPDAAAAKRLTAPAVAVADADSGVPNKDGTPNNDGTDGAEAGFAGADPASAAGAAFSPSSSS